MKILAEKIFDVMAKHKQDMGIDNEICKISRDSSRKVDVDCELIETWINTAPEIRLLCEDIAKMMNKVDEEDQHEQRTCKGNP